MSANAPVELSYAVRGRVLRRYIGQLLVVLAALMAPPLVVSLIAREWIIAWRLAIMLAFMLGVGWLLSRTRAAAPGAPGAIQRNEATVVAVSMFLIAPLAMVWPMMSSGLSFLDALFEAVSGVTTTGLSATATVEDKSATFLFTRAWMQWFGGLGIVVLSVALLMEAGAAARQLATHEESEGDLVGGARATARRVLIIYVWLTLPAIVVPWALGGDFFEALLHALSSVSTGGFSPNDDSLAGLPNIATAYATIVFCLLGAVPLMLYRRGYRNGWGDFVRDPQVRTLIAACAVFIVLLGVCMLMVGGRTWGDVLRHAPLTALTAQTTAGFSTIDPAELDPASKLLLVFSMLLGGGVGSTAGGMKVLRLAILLRLVQVVLMRSSLSPHAVLEPRIAGRRLHAPEIHTALMVMSCFVVVTMVSWLLFVAHGYEAIDALFEVASATGTVGLSVGITRPDLEPLLKAVLCVDMLLGRLEIFALLILLYPRTWLGKRAKLE